MQVCKEVTVVKSRKDEKNRHLTEPLLGQIQKKCPVFSHKHGCKSHAQKNGISDFSLGVQ